MAALDAREFSWVNVLIEDLQSGSLDVDELVQWHEVDLVGHPRIAVIADVGDSEMFATSGGQGLPFFMLVDERMEVIATGPNWEALDALRELVGTDVE